MARSRRRARRPSRRKDRSRLWRRLGAVALIVVPVLYFAFTRVFFDPFESAQPPFHLLAPRDADLYARREALAADFDPFPRPRVLERWMRTPAFRAMAGTDWYASTGWPTSMDELVGDWEDALRELPLDPLADVLGREAAVVGREVGTAGRHVLLARLSAKGKMAYELLRYPSVLRKALPGASMQKVVAEIGAGITYHRLDPAGGEPLFLARLTDLLVVGDDEELVRDVLRTQAEGPDQSLGYSRLYAEHAPPPPEVPGARFSADVALDAAHLVDAFELAPDTDEPKEDAIANALPRLIDVTLLRDVVGRLEVDETSVDLVAHGELDGQRAAAHRGGLAGEPEFVAHERLGDVAAMLPPDVAAVAVANVDLRRFLTTLAEGLAPDVRLLADRTLKDIARFNPGWRVHDVPTLVEELSRVLGGRIAIVLRKAKHVVPEGLQPLPTIGFIANIRDAEGLDKTAQAFINGHQFLGVLEGSMFKYEHGVGTRKYLGFAGLPFETISFVPLDRKTFVITTDDRFTADIIDAYIESKPSLGTDAGLRRVMDRYRAASSRANAALWVDARRFEDVLEPYAAWTADMETQLDFGVLRAKRLKEVLSRDHPQHRGKREDELPEPVREVVDRRLDELMDEAERERVAETVPAVAEAWAERWSWLALLDQLSGALRLGERTMDLHVQVETVLER